MDSLHAAIDQTLAGTDWMGMSGNIAPVDHRMPPSGSPPTDERWDDSDIRSCPLTMILHTTQFLRTIGWSRCLLTLNQLVTTGTRMQEWLLAPIQSSQIQIDGEYALLNISYVLGLGSEGDISNLCQSEQLILGLNLYTVRIAHEFNYLKHTRKHFRHEDLS